MASESMKPDFSKFFPEDTAKMEEITGTPAHAMLVQAGLLPAPPAGALVLDNACGGGVVAAQLFGAIASGSGLATTRPPSTRWTFLGKFPNSTDVASHAVVKPAEVEATNVDFCNFIHDISAPIPSSSPNRLPELLDALRDVLDPPDPVSLVPKHGVSPHIPGEGWTLVNDTSVTKDDLLCPVSLPDFQLSRLSSIKNDSFDSGYGSEFSSPQPLPSTLVLVSPLSALPSPTSTRDRSPDLDSPSTVRHSISLEQEDEDDDTQYATAQWDVSGSSTCLDDPPQPGSRFSSCTSTSSDDVCNDTSFRELPQPGSRFSSSTEALTEDGATASIGERCLLSNAVSGLELRNSRLPPNLKLAFTSAIW
ncbi:hypothetical protein GGX14DRAFT_587882 [Mycena pura]|uniref:Uncharacterized protein n=1 Tax=Mycena pura TaxID=153505 RepID=A0AAD6UZR4_9AGAR|nr:hypothetical protein GGX14DRAFT_587882 [Mycena pura]